MIVSHDIFKAVFSPAGLALGNKLMNNKLSSKLFDSSDSGDCFIAVDGFLWSIRLHRDNLVYPNGPSQSDA